MPAIRHRRVAHRLRVRAYARHVSLAAIVRQAPRAARAGAGRFHGLRLQRAELLDAAHLIGAAFATRRWSAAPTALCRMTLHGFAALDLISPVPCRPCDAERAASRSVRRPASPCWSGPKATGVACSATARAATAITCPPHIPEARVPIAAMRAALAQRGSGARSRSTTSTCTAPARERTTQWKTWRCWQCSSNT